MLAARIAISDNSRITERAAHFEAHKQYLRSGGLKILKSGPFAHETLKGALILADVESLEEMKCFNAHDPFVIHGVYKVVHIVEWSVTYSAATGPGQL